jgi:hypothetical protein
MIYLKQELATVPAPTREQVKAYLESHGWTEGRSSFTGCMAWNNPKFDHAAFLNNESSETFQDGDRADEVIALAEIEGRSEMDVYRDIMGIQRPPTLFQVLKALESSECSMDNPRWTHSIFPLGKDELEVGLERQWPDNTALLSTDEEVYTWLREVAPEVFE